MQSKPLWTPTETYKNKAELRKFQTYLVQKGVCTADADYDTLWQWSVANMADFWQLLTDYFQIKWHLPYQQVINENPDNMIGTTWFEGGTLSYAEHIFRNETTLRPAIIFQDESHYCEISWADLRKKVTAIQQYLLQLGIKKGDRVAGYLTNSPDTIAIFLAVNSIGAIWSCCSPDFGTDSVVDRFQQIEPKIFFATAFYSYNGKIFDKSDTIKAISANLPTLEDVVVVDSMRWRGILANFNPFKPLHFESVPFDHPIWILYSSGTTGKPKAITHSTGGNLIEHLKALALHQNVQAGDRFFWYSTTGWMMWNYALSSLLCGATLCLYDGATSFPTNTALWDFAKQAQVNHFGSGAAFYIACMQAQLPLKELQLPLKTIGSTGSPLPPDTFDWLYEQFSDVHLISLSGGTDVCSAFLSGCPYLPVFEGEIQCRTLGSAIAIYNDNGEAVINEVGELIIEKPMPSMPIYFWNDEGNIRYIASYFEKYKNKWCHGDWIKQTENGGFIIYGRSDATLNRGGVRIGTAEIYNGVNEISEIKDSLVVCIDKEDGSAYMPLYVVLNENEMLTEALKKRIKNTLRTKYSPRHIPDDIIEVSAIPYTISGKKMELPVKKLLMGQPIEKVVSLDSMRNPEALDFWK